MTDKTLITYQPGASRIRDTGFEDDVYENIEEYERITSESVAGNMQPRARVIFEQARHLAAMKAATAVSDIFDTWLHYCESEVEKIFLAALVAESQMDSDISLPHVGWLGDDVSAFVRDQLDGFLWSKVEERGPTPITVLMQVPVGEYRADFLIYGISAHSADPSKWLRIKLIVECDGHEFHEKTKAQAQRDKKRDRTLTTMGFTVMRFTGSEIWRDPRKCVLEAIKFVQSQQWEDHAKGFWRTKS